MVEMEKPGAPKRTMTRSTHERVYDVVEQIPRGRVATYGQVARLAGLGGQARLVGYALHAADRPLPWHRVVNAKGRISRRIDAGGAELQRELLIREGVEFDERNQIPLEVYGWSGSTTC